MSEEEAQERIKEGKINDLVSVKDSKRGCPEMRWDGPYTFRCGLGINKCAIHGVFSVKIRE